MAKKYAKSPPHRVTDARGSGLGIVPHRNPVVHGLGDAAFRRLGFLHEHRQALLLLLHIHSGAWPVKSAYGAGLGLAWWAGLRRLGVNHPLGYIEKYRAEVYPRKLSVYSFKSQDAATAAVRAHRFNIVVSQINRT